VTYLLVVLVVGVGAAAQASSGFGFALLTVPLLAVLVGPKTAVVADNVIGIGLVSLMVLRNRHGVERRTVLVVSAAAIVAMPLGLVILTVVDPRVLLAIIGATVLGLTAALVKGLSFPDRDGTDLVAGFCSGLLATSTGTNGPPLVIALHGKDLEPAVFRATLAAAFLVQSVATLVAFTATGKITDEVGRAALAGYVGIVPGLFAGERLAARLDPGRFRVVVVAMLVVSALASIARAVW
jgi:uncharacterized membrane protein YfcA